MTITLNALAPTLDINRMVELANNAAGSKVSNLIRPEVFYSKQLLDTIRIASEDYCYYKLADESPIQDKAEKLTLRRWAPLQAHTIPLVEGVPPKSDKGSVEKYEMEAHQYGRYMEFSDKVDFTVVDPVIAHYTNEYSIVAVETLDMLARETLFSLANPFYAGQVPNFESLTIGSKPSMTDLRLVVLHFKRTLVKPRKNGKYLAIVSPEFTYDMISDPTVEKFMTINQTTRDAYDGSVLFPMFGLEFKESLVAPATGDFYKVESSNAVECKRLVRYDSASKKYDYITVKATDKTTDQKAICTIADGYVKDARTGKDASYIPSLRTWNIEGASINDSKGTAHTDWQEFKVHHVLIVGKDALTRTGLSGEGSAKMYVKQKGSAGVLDPIDQRQSIGFKINSVGFGSTRPEAIVDYMCVPSTANIGCPIDDDMVHYYGEGNPYADKFFDSDAKTAYENQNATTA